MTHNNESLSQYSIITPYSMDEFAWSKKQGVLYNNILFGVVSIISATNFLSARFTSKL